MHLNYLGSNHMCIIRAITDRPYQTKTLFYVALNINFLRVLFSFACPPLHLEGVVKSFIIYE